MHFFAPLLRSRARTAAGAAVAATALFAHALWAPPWMLHESTSVGANLALILAWILLSAAVGFCCAVLAAESLFGALWKARFFGLGEPDPVGDDDVAAQVGALRSRTFPFSLLLLGFSGLAMGGTNAMADDFFARYERVGYHRALFAGENDGLRIAALEQVADDYGPAMIDRLPLVAGLLDEQQAGRLRRAAAAALARMCRAAQGSLKDLAAAGAPVQGEWEADLLATAREVALPRLDAVLTRSDDGLLRMSAWLFVAAAQPESLIERVRAQQAALAANPGERRALTVAMGRLASLDFLPWLVRRLARDDDPEVRAAAAWAIGGVVDRYDPSRAMRGVVDDRVTQAVDALTTAFDDADPTVRCAVFDALRFVRDASLSRQLFGALEAASRGDECPSLAVRLVDDAPIQLVRGGSLRVKILEAIAAISVGNRRVLARLDMLLSEEQEYGPEVLAVVRAILRTAQAAPSP